MSGFLSWISDPAERRAVAMRYMDAINRGVVAGTLGAPVDMANTGINLVKSGVGFAGHKMGLLSTDQLPQLDDRPVGGSEWVGQKMQNAGMVSGHRNPMAEGIAGGLLAPAGGVALQQRAPQIASGLLAVQKNAAAPSTIRNQGQRGMVNVKPTAPGWADDFASAGGKINPDGTVTVYHRTTPESAKLIRESGVMRGAEDGVFFSSIPDGAASSFGAEVLEMRIPASRLNLDDLFSSEAHFRLPTKRAGAPVFVSEWLAKK